MALDPLKFAVQITDEASEQLKQIKSDLDKLQNKDITINVSGNLGDFLNLFKDGLDVSKFDNLKKTISDAMTGIDSLNKAAKEGNFADYAGQINTAKEAVAALGNAIAGVNNVVGSNEGFQKFMVSIGEVVTRVDAALKQLNESSNANGGVMGSKSIEKAKYELYQFDNLVKQAEQTSRLGKQFGDVDTTGLDKAIEKLKAYRAELDQISQTGKGEKGRGFDKFALQAEYKEAVDKVKKLSAEQHTTEMNLGRYNQMLVQTNELWDRIINAWVKGSSLFGGAATNPVMQPAERQAHDFLQRLQSLNAEDMNNAQIISQLAAEFQRLKSTLTATAKEQEKLNAATEKQKAKDQADATKKTQRENEAWAKSMRDASTEANKLGIELNRLRKIEQAGSDVGADTTKLRQYISTLETYKVVLDEIAAGNRNLGHASDWISGKSSISGFDTLGNTGRLAKEAAGAVRELTAEKQRSTSATSQLTNEEQRLAQALNQTAESAKGQSQVLSDLKSMAMQYLGVWGGQQFLHNIIEIGGQLEMQRLSIGAILQNQGQANELFEKIKGLAIQSPFGVVELDQMTKQLTAYGFKYSELFDMTKRLADISAATGTGVDRLALALGHVRSEAALSGYTLRQFSMGNVPLLQKLSEKLGKTTQEIRKMVRSKEISYEDVEGVIKDLTNEGGMFYNMQETISQSVKARFKNVKDAMDIMYGEMAEGGLGSVLKEIALLLMKLTKNWKTVGAAITGAVAPMVIYKLAMMASAKAITVNNVATGQFTAKQLEAQAITGNLTKKMLLQAVASGKLAVADAEAAAATLGLTRAQLQFVARSGSVAAATNKATLATSKFTVAQLRSLAVARDNSYSMLTRWLARLKFGFGVAGGAAKAFGATLAGLMRSFLPLAAMSAVFAIISRSVEASSKAQEMAKDIAENARDTQKSINTVIQEQADDKLLRSIEKSKLSVNGHYVVQNAIEFNDEALNKTNLTERIKSLREELQNLSPLYSGDVIDISEAKSQVEQYEILVNKLESLRHVNDVNEATSNVFPNANKRVQGGNWFTRMFGDSFTTDLTDYSNRMEDSVEEINQITEVELGKIDEALNGKLSKLQEDLNLSSLGEALKLYFLNGKRELEKGSTDFNAELYTVINSTGDKQKLKDYYDSFFDPVTFGRSLHSQRSQVLGETKKMSKAIMSTISTYFKDDPEGAVYALKGFFDRMFSEAGVTDNSVMQETINKILDDMRGMLGEGGQEIVDEFQRRQVKIQFSNFINPGEIEGAKSKEELDALFQSYLNKIHEWAKIYGIDLEKLGLEAGGKFSDGFRKAFDAAKNQEMMLKDWQKRAGKVFDVNTEIKVKTKTITSIDEFAQAVQKDLKEKQEYITRNASHIRQTLTINAGIKFNLDKLDTKSLNDMIIALGTRVQSLLLQGKVDAAQALNSVIQDELLPFRDALASIDENKKWLKQEGYPEKDPTKDKSKNKHDSKKSYKDPVAEEWKERIRLLKDANSLYKEWNKREGEDEALNRVRQQYGDIFEKWRTDKNVPWKDFKAEDIIEYRNYIQKIVDEAQKRYDAQRNDKAKNYGKEAEAVLREGKKLLDDIDRYDFDEKAKDFTAAATKSIEQLNKRWEIFKSTVDTTGDALLAAQLAGFGDAERGARTAAEAMRNELVKQLEQLGGSDLVAKIPLDIDLNEEEVRDIFLNAIPNADAVEDYKESINALIKLYQEWQKLQQKTNSDDIGIYTKIIGLASSYDAQLRKINKDLQEQLASISANPLLSSGQKAGASLMANASADWKKMKLSADYANLHNRAVAMSAEEYEKAEKKIKDLIERLRLLGMMSPEEEISETKALDKAASERRQDVGGALSHFITGGAQGLKDYYQRLADAALENRSRYSAGSAEWKKADEEYKKNQERADAIDDEIAGIQATQAALENLRKAASMLSDFFVAIAGESSNEGAALGSISGGALGGASSLSGFGPWGMAAGAILGGATAMIQEGDKATERAINKLRGDVQLIESDLGVILKQRERTLGYDTDNSYLRRLYNAQADLIGQFGSNADRFGNESQKKNATASWGSSIMRDYYQKLMDSSSSGYQSQYNALIEERANYLAILDEQNEKKNKSNEEIAETQKKIAELDDQIAYFAQDLAKELWSIDIKGWADQLSDALASAFENGENMAKAYRDTVTQIIQQMMQKMMQMAILEPMFERLQKQLFGENGNGGVFDPNNPKGSMSKITAMIGDFFGKGGEGEKAITASMEFMTAFQRGMQNAGLTVLNEASNTLSSSMQGTTEETSGLLAGYVNALRQDVSVNRILLTQFVSQMWPDYMDTFANQVTAVQNIDTNVQVIMTMMQMGNGAMFNEIAAMRSRIDNVVMGIDKFAVK